MNRSFRAQESQMQAAAERQRQQLRASMMMEKEEELALFLEMRKREKEQSNLLLNHAEEFDAPLGSKPGTSPIFNISTATHARKTGPDDFLSSDNDKNDYDWLLTPPGTPLFPSLETESQRTITSQLGDPKAWPTALNIRLANSQAEPAARSSLASRQPPSPGLSSSSGLSRRPSSSGGPGSRPLTPTGRSTLTSNSKASRPSTPTSRATLPSVKPSASATKTTAPASRPTASSTRLTPAARPTSATTKPTGALTKPTGSVTKPAGASTKPIAAATRPTVPSRSTTPLSRTTARSSTPTSRPTIPTPKPTSRASTPTRRPSTPSRAPSLSVPQAKSSASAMKPTIIPARNPVSSNGTSPSVRSRPWKPSDMPGYSLETPPNLRTTLPERPLSATRGRPGAPSSRSSSVEPGPTGRPRRQSCSPSRGRAPNGVVMHASGGSVPAVNRAYAKANDNVSPVVIGTKMVERVISMRKLGPPRSDDHRSSPVLSVKSSSPDSAGFGRSLSKKSLDMAIRHMDIRRSIPGNLRPLMTNIPASSMYSVRSGPARSRPVSVSDSPLATSSNASSEVSVNNNSLCQDVSEREEREDDVVSERGCRSPSSMQER